MIGLLGAAHAADPSALALSADGGLAIIGTSDGGRTVWRRDGAPPLVVPPVDTSGHPRPDRRFTSLPGAVRWVVVSADGRTAVSGHEAGMVAVFDPRTGRAGPVVAVDVFGPITGPWTALRVPGSTPPGICGNGPRELPPPLLSADGERLVTVGLAGAETRIALWNTGTGALLRTWTSDEPAATLAFDGAHPVIQTGSAVVVLGAVPRFVAHDVLQARVDGATGRIVLTGAGGDATLDLATGVVTPVTRAAIERERPLTARTPDGVEVWVGSDGAPRWGLPTRQ